MPQRTTDPQHAAHHLAQGLPLAIPTETVYGLAAPIASTNALENVFAIKQRPLFDPLITHTHDTHAARALTAHWPPEAQQLADAHWPGPLTLVLPKSPHVPDLVTAGLPTAAIRVPDHPLTHQLLAITGPLAAPSANRFGRTSPTHPDHVEAEFPERDDLLILDAGPTTQGIESTIVDLTSDQPTILRPGPVTAIDLENTLNRPVAPPTTHNPAQPTAPGQLDTHYAPAVPLLLVHAPEPLDDHALVELAEHHLPEHADQPAVLHLNHEPTTAARTLYADLRHLASPPHSCIVCQLPPPIKHTNAPHAPGGAKRMTSQREKGGVTGRGGLTGRGGFTGRAGFTGRGGWSAVADRLTRAASRSIQL